LRRASIGILGLFCAIQGTAQTTAEPSKPKVIICDESAACVHEYISGRKYKMLVSDKVTVIVAVESVGKYSRADVYVANDGPTTIDVLPENFILAETLPKDKLLRPVDVGKAIRSAERQMAFANALTAIGANHAQRQTTTNTATRGAINAKSSDGTSAQGTYGEHSTSTISSPDYAAQARASETIQARSDAMANVASFASRTVLRSTSLTTGKTIRGYLVFERDKKAKWANFGGLIGGTVYMFQLDVSGQ
jgi:hypothetical protein